MAHRADRSSGYRPWWAVSATVGAGAHQAVAVLDILGDDLEVARHFSGHGVDPVDHILVHGLPRPKELPRFAVESPDDAVLAWNPGQDLALLPGGHVRIAHPRGVFVRLHFDIDQHPLERVVEIPVVSR